MWQIFHGGVLLHNVRHFYASDIDAKARTICRVPKCNHAVRSPLYAMRALKVSFSLNRYHRRAINGSSQIVMHARVHVAVSSSQPDRKDFDGMTRKAFLMMVDSVVGQLRRVPPIATHPVRPQGHARGTL
jgi:hypothetical protein